MKKYFTLFFTIIGIVAIVNGQKSKRFSDDFESYTANSWLAQSSAVWTTWSGTPSSSGDDVRVTTSDAYSGSKSIYFNAGPGPEDVVLPFGGLHERGQFVFRAMMKIPSGKSAYFNFQGAVSVGTTWSAEVNFNTDSTIVFSNTTSGSMFQSTYPQGKWFEMKVYINLTKNEWNVYIDNVYRGYFANSINKVSFLDIYPVDKDASFWMDDVSYIYAAPSTNNAAVEALTSPKKAICGKNDFKVKLANNGINALDSVRVYWTVDGVLQSPVFVKSAIDTIKSSSGNTLEVTLDSVLKLSNGLHRIKVWTAYPNGASDTLNFDDTLYTSVKAEIDGVGIEYVPPFQGKKGAGTAVWPDTVCAGDTINYGVTPPTGYSNADLGTNWTINYVNIKSNGVPPKDTITVMPSGKTNFLLRYMADTSEGNSVFKLEISVSVGSGCDTVLTHYFFVSPQPHVAFTATEACVGKGVFFNNKSKGGTKNKYLWNFGDKTTSKLMNTSKPYFTAGKYNVTLKTTAPSGCSATASQEVTIHDIPVPSFSVKDACDSSSVVFSDSSTVDNGTITKYFWDFGDNDTSNVQNPTHLYKSAGTYKVRLSVTSNHGCTKTTNEPVEVYPVPNASISGTNKCELDSVVFGNKTSYTGTDALTYVWDFGDGNQSSRKKPSHLYATPGKYSVKMKTVSTHGCKDSTQLFVEVYAIPVADFSMNNNCQGETTAFTNNSSISSGNIVSYHWQFGNGRTETIKEPVFKFSKARTYSVQLLVIGNGGCKDSIIKDLEIYPVPQALFSLNNACQGVEVAYDNQSTSTSDTLEFTWDFGDGNKSTAQTPVNTYNQDGVYKVQLIAKSENGCIDSIEQSIEIYPLPESGFTFVHKGFKQYDFTPDNSNLKTYFWDFGDGDTSSDVTPYHEYAAEGNYDVTLKTTDDNGCVSEKTIEVSVSTGIDETDNLSPFTVFPNPFKDEVNIVYELQNEGNVLIEIYTLNGMRLVSMVNQKQSKGEYQYKFNSPDASGIYMIRMVIDGNVYHERIVKAQ